MSYKEYGRVISLEDMDRLKELYKTRRFTRADMAKRFNISLRYVSVILKGISKYG